MTIAGPVKVELYGATDGPDTDFMAKLVDVDPDGYEALVLDAPVRARYRQDSSLLGGALIKVGSTIYDGSVSEQLERIREQLVES